MSIGTVPYTAVEIEPLIVYLIEGGVVVKRIDSRTKIDSQSVLMLLTWYEIPRGGLSFQAELNRTQRIFAGRLGVNLL